MPEGSTFSREIEATASFQHDLDIAVENNFPFAGDERPDITTRYLSGDLNSCSFELHTPISQNNKKILETALEYAGNPVDRLNPLVHKSKNVSPEPIEALISALRTDQLVCSKGTVTVKTTVGGHKNLSAATRLFVESPRFTRTTFEPIPFVKALALRGNEASELREIAVQEGLSSAVLIGMYRRMSVERMMDILGNRDFVHTRMPKNRPTLSPNHDDDERWLTILHNKLVKPVQTHEQKTPFSSGEYLEALDFVSQIGWLHPKEQDNEQLFGFREVERSPYARAVFMGASEYAQYRASNSYFEPARTNYIDRKYGNRFTTNVSASYFVMDE